MTESRSPSSRSLLGGYVAALLLAALLAAAAIVSTPLVSAAAGWWRSSHGQFGSHHGHDPERVREHAELAISFLLDRVDATEEQEARVLAIVAESIDGVFELAEQHRENRSALVDELAGTSIDRDALEAIRRSELELADVASRRLTETLADVAEVLTPEQRGELIELAQRFRH